MDGKNISDDPNDILQYLLATENVVQSEGDFLKKTRSGNVYAKRILHDLLDKVDNRLHCKEEYAAKCRAHNQSKLFNLLDTFPDFEINERMYEALTFRETLLVSQFDERSTAAPTPVGGICIDVQKAEGAQPIEREGEDHERRLMKNLERNFSALFHANDSKIEFHRVGSSTGDGRVPICEDPLTAQNTYGLEKMVVHVSSSFLVEGCNAGSRITSWVDRNLHTIEELRKEYICRQELEEKTLYMALKPRSYYVHHKDVASSIVNKSLYSMQKAKDYVSEGASIILMRYLAIQRYMGTFELACCYIDGAMCRNIYECTGPESGMVNNKKMDICKIKRLIVEECGLQHKCSTVLTTEGQLINQEWEGCDFVIHVNPCARLKNERPIGNDEVLLTHNWRKDIQLLSKFLDQKTMIQMKNKSYIFDHPELKNIISDYVNAILLMKPAEIMDFTVKYFGAFVPQTFPRTEYMEEKYYM